MQCPLSKLSDGCGNSHSLIYYFQKTIYLGGLDPNLDLDMNQGYLLDMILSIVKGIWTKFLKFLTSLVT